MTNNVTRQRDRNKLKGLDQSVFKSLLDYFKKNNIKASISNGNSKLLGSSSPLIIFTSLYK